jgi:ABC-type multidrug transport system ATPase subunit
MDPVARRFMWRVLSGAASRSGVTTIIVSHLMEEVDALW